MSDWKGTYVQIRVYGKYEWKEPAYVLNTHLDTDTFNDILDKYHPEEYYYEVELIEESDERD